MHYIINRNQLHAGGTPVAGRQVAAQALSRGREFITPLKQVYLMG